MGSRPRAAQERNDAAGEGETTSRATKRGTASSTGSRRSAKHEAQAQRRRSRPGAGAAAEQRRVRLHHSRPDGRRHPADARVPRRSRQRGRLRQLGGIAGDVAGPGEEVPRGRAARRRPSRPQAATGSPSPRTRWSPIPIATSTACGGSSTSTSGSGPTTPTISWPPGGSSTAQALGQPGATLADVAAEAGISRQVPGDGLVDPDGTGRGGRADRRVAVDVARAAARRRRGTETDAARQAASGCAISSSSSASSSRRRSRT